MQFRLRDFAHPVAIVNLRRMLARSERWSSSERDRWQRARLRELLVHAHENCPFWAPRLDAATFDPSVGDAFATLRRLPILTKDDVRGGLDQLRSRRTDEHSPTWSETSGSTGTALRFLLDRPTHVLEFATLWRQFNWAGYRFGTRFADLRGHLIRAPSGIARDYRLNALNLSAFHLSRERSRDYAAALGRFRPVMVRGYPSSIALFSSWVLEERIDLPQPACVVTSSETLLAPQREIIERAFRAPVFDYYGQMERVAFAGQCAAGLYHVAPEYGIVELLDDDEREVREGESGRIIATGLHHRAMPLIRYETRDLAVRGPDRCDCGRTSPTFARIIGRREDIVVTPDGRHVGRLDAAFRYSDGIRLAQIVQDDVSAIRVDIVRGEAYSDGDEPRLIAELRLRLGDRIGIEMNHVDALALDRSGKLKFVVSSIGRSVERRALGLESPAPADNTRRR